MAITTRYEIWVEFQIPQGEPNMCRLWTRYSEPEALEFARDLNKIYPNLKIEVSKRVVNSEKDVIFSITPHEQE